MPGNYSIVEAQYFITGGFGHNLLVLIDPDGNVLQEFDGLATGADGSEKPIGYLLSDKLYVYETPGIKLYSASQPQATLFTGSLDEVMQRWRAGETCAEAINDLNVSYPLLVSGKTVILLRQHS